MKNVAFQHATPWAGSDRNKAPKEITQWSSIPFRVDSQSIPFILVTFLPVNETLCFNVSVTRHAATLDTEPRAKSYSGGSRTHLFSNHFQYARRVVWSLSSLGRGSSSLFAPSFPAVPQYVDRAQLLLRTLSEPDERC